MMRSAVAVSLVPEVRGGPFLFWDDLGRACEVAAGLGFDAIEVFPPSADAVERPLLKKLLEGHGLALAAGTGPGWVKQRLALTSPDAGNREKARAFVRSIIDLAGEFSAPAIIGSMKGRHGPDWLPADEARARLGEALAELGEHARPFGVPLLYEPLNRYETDLCCRLADGVALLKTAGGNVKLLADLFHMNIEEDDSAAALRGVGYGRYLSAEAFSVPDDETAARRTIEAFRKYFR